ncbi:ATP-binding protein [Actinocorallia sp. A-T 12471]|uniref:ATP-binding protein n=1 Tax=Actinocorallia sp. A-T 12471 TaxID=3089813 RepID=UPI0029CF7E32|nr:AAA family ATPase [Actinocorallia sp. A-T 12471]MDX6740244.1 AAA family ATPase [Actinocorallia sp. A-T 12471]
MFVDRLEDMKALVELAGRGVVVEGDPGAGKSRLLTEFVQRASGGQRVVFMQYPPVVASRLPYTAIADLVHELAEPPSRARRALTFTGQAALRSGPEVLSWLMPPVGAAFRIGQAVTQAAVRSGSAPLDSLMTFQQASVVQIAGGIIDLVRQGQPVLLVIDDVQHLDPDSLHVLDRVLRTREADLPLGVVVSHTTGPEADRRTTGLVDEWVRLGFLRHRRLDGLPVDAVAELVRYRHPAARPGLARMLCTKTRGHAGFIEAFLDEWRPGDDESAISDSMRKLADRRLDHLAELDRRLIMVASVQGPVFLSWVVAKVAGQPHDLVMDRLRAIAENYRLIVPYDELSWAPGIDCYRFQHHALGQAVYELQSPGQRFERHGGIADVLLTLGDEPRSSMQKVEIARHLASAGPRRRVEAGIAFLELAREAAFNGMSAVVADRHLTIAVECLAGRDRELFEAIELQLSLTEERWRGKHVETGPPHDIDGLAAKAEAAAVRSGDDHLIVRSLLLRGKTLLVTEGLEPSLVKLWAAVERAEQSADKVARFIANVEYGRQISKIDLDRGLRHLREAEELYLSSAEPLPRDAVLQHIYNLGEMQLGISLFDSGKLGEALRRLTACVERLRTEPLNVELPIALNYLAQIQRALGLDEECRRTLTEARDFEARRGGKSGWHAYNTALLALLVADTDPGRAQELIEHAWQETTDTWLLNLVPIVRNLYAEVLLITGRDLDEADRLAGGTYSETGRTKMVRSRIAALILRSRIQLLRGDPVMAHEYASEAVRLLDAHGDLPALRTEEVLFYASEAAHHAGEPSSEALLERAREVVVRKLGTIPDAAHSRSFRTAVPLNRRILSDDPFTDL